MDVRVGRRTAQVMLWVTDQYVEVGTHQRRLFLNSVLVEYEHDRGYWRWETVTVFGAFGDGKPGTRAWRRDINTDLPDWMVLLIYKHVPEFREVRR